MATAIEMQKPLSDVECKGMIRFCLEDKDTYRVGPVIVEGQPLDVARCSVTEMIELIEKLPLYMLKELVQYGNSLLYLFMTDLEYLMYGSETGLLDFAVWADDADYVLRLNHALYRFFTSVRS